MRRKRLWYRMMSMALAAAVTAATLPPAFAGDTPAVPPAQSAAGESSEQPESTAPELPETPVEAEPASPATPAPEVPEVMQTPKAEEVPQAPAEPPAEVPVPEPVTEDAAPAETAELPAGADAPAALDPVAPAVQYYTLKIHYYYQDANGALTTAHPPETRELEGGKPYTVVPPVREGYEITTAEGSDALTGTMDADKTVTLLYIGAEVAYTVHHVFPDDPTLNSDETLTGRIGTATAAKAREVPGYTAGAVENFLLTGQTDSVTISYAVNHYNVFFDTQGGSAVPSQLNVRYGSEIEMPAAPTRTGYTFGGWYTDADANGDAVAGPVAVTGQTTYYAKWTAEKVAFTVVVMRENADDALYSYAATVTVPARTGVPAGTEITENSALKQAIDSALTDSEKKYFTYASLESGVVAQPDGSSVVVAYYSRNRYTMAFVLNDKNAVITCAGQTYRNGDYKFTAKYGANIAAVWPTIDTDCSCVISGKKGFSGWSRPNASHIFTSMRLELIPELIGSPTAGSTTTYTAGWQSHYTYKLFYRLQDLDGNGFTEMPRYTQRVESQSGADSWSAKDIAEGSFVADSKKIDESQDPTTITFDYTRNRFSITYHNLGETEVKGGIPYGTPLDESYRAAPARPEGLADYYTFAGWYADPVFKTPYAFTTMPAGNVALYAHWTAPTATVSFESAGGSAVEAQSVTKGQKATRPEPPTRAGYTFLGWYTGEDALYDFYGTTVTADLTLTAHWQQATLADYTVRYRFEDGSVAAPDHTVQGARVGGTVKAQAIPLTGDYADYAPDALYKTLTIDPDADQNVITFTYAPGRTFAYTLVYGWRDGDTFTEFTALRSTGTTHKSAVLLPNAHPDIPGYDSMNSSVYHELNLNGPTEFRYEYTPCDYTLTYRLEGGTLQAENPASYRISSQPLAIPNNPTRPGYEFLGWASDDAGVVTGLQAAIEAGTTGNKTLTATWKQNIVRLTVTAASEHFVYDALPHECDEVTVTDGALKEGDTLVATATGSVTNVSDNALNNNPVASDVKVMHDALDVTENYEITTQAGTLTIDPRPLTLITDSATKEWDGTPLTATGHLTGLVPGETLHFTMLGSQTDPGESKDTARLDWTDNATTANPENYTVTTEFGTLQVEANHAAITLAAQSARRVYDGTPLTQPDITAADLPEGFTATAVMTEDSRLVDVGSVPNVIASFQIFDPEGNDVTEDFDNVIRLPGTLSVNRRTAYVTSPDARKVYDAKPLRARYVSQDGFVPGEGVVVRVTGSRTNVGSSANTFSYTARGDTKLTNYTIVRTTGVLTVTPTPVEIIGNKGSFVYDGKPHTVNGAVVKGIAEGFTLHISVAGVTRTKVGTSVMNLKDATYQVTLNGETGTYEDGVLCYYINNYLPRITDGSITITPKPAPGPHHDDKEDSPCPATPTPAPDKVVVKVVVPAPAGAPCIPATYGGWHEGFVPTTAHPLPGISVAELGTVPDRFSNVPAQAAAPLPVPENKPNRTAGLCALVGCGLAALFAAKKRKKGRS